MDGEDKGELTLKDIKTSMIRRGHIFCSSTKEVSLDKILSEAGIDS